MTNHFDDDPDAEFPIIGVPPAPSVTLGPNPPPPVAAEDESHDQRGCVAVLIVGAVLAVIALVLAIVLVAVGLRLFGSSNDNDNATILSDVVVETGIATASSDVVHPPQRDIHLGACEGDGADGVKASGTLKNWTSESADYSIDVSFRTSGFGSTGEEFAARSLLVQAVPELATTNWSVVAPKPPAGAYACRVVSINRWPSGTTPPP